MTAPLRTHPPMHTDEGETVAETEALLDELERLRAAATPGPWEVDGALGPSMGAAILPPAGYSETPVIALDAGVIREADAAAIVAAHNALPELLRLARERHALEAAVLALAEELDGERDGYGYAIRNGLKPGPADRLRSTVTAALAGQHATDEEADRG